MITDGSKVNDSSSDDESLKTSIDDDSNDESEEAEEVAELPDFGSNIQHARLFGQPLHSNQKGTLLAKAGEMLENSS